MTQGIHKGKLTREFRKIFAFFLSLGVGGDYNFLFVIIYTHDMLSFSLMF